MEIDKQALDRWLTTEPEERPTFRFYQGAHLTYITDAEGAVVGIEILPYQEMPVADEYQEQEPYPTEEELEAVCEKASALCWQFSPLDNLPAGISWEG
jgi:hypothetical protein